jgi:type IV pilus assembly protein PilC
MATFTYKARDAQGQSVSGVIEAEAETAAALRVEKLGLIPVSIKAQAEYVAPAPAWRFGARKVSYQELLVFTRQLATLSATGAPLLQSLRNVAEQTDNPRFRAIVNNIISAVEGGSSLSEALAMHPEVFRGLYISLVKVGETAGILDKVLRRLSEISTKEIDLRSRLRSALIYPAVLSLVAFAIVNFVLVGVLPKFVAIFEASSAKLPLPTKILLFLSNALRSYWWLLAAGALVIFSALRNYYRTEAGRYHIDSVLLRLPLFGPLNLKVMVAGFSRSVAALTQSGIPVLEALAVVENTVSNSVLRRMLRDTRKAISEGQSLTEPFRASGLFPPMVIQLINTGERSGKLDEMFNQIADFYEPEIEFTVRNMTSLLEPVMLLAMGLVVSFIALSVLLPIFNLISVIRR